MYAYVLFCWSHKVNTMAIGDKLDKKVLFDPQARNALLIQSTQTALMKFMELFAHIFFLHIFIYLFKSKILLFRATGVQCKIAALFHNVSE